ncbi:hypothetical protein CO174_00160 [Candidatus Uhrbacteria bacterium CG_4_9_14_3_um_filter_50_9]|uniref:VanZ-like domain-containing protein n=1 Tax=Candidatus Uhrbacteria bacterium CG_4_9_14_3_um_filter_50_9 TaxID=1975035 RepID=A0A2M7XEX2_9BACT|nr:MAG: hypothetical protein CO174_00160 [Candidatus Uhrbacteria bacterium CG_4_9_14_3_um_filter_50_9]
MKTMLLSKRWWLYFLLLFVIWYPVSVLLFTYYELTGNPYTYIVSNIFTPLWFLFVGFLYFRKARNDWSARFVTAFGWIFLTFLLEVLLVEPVYGYSWEIILNLEVLVSNWINVVAVLVAGVAAQMPGTLPPTPQDKIQDVIENGPKGR